MMAARTRKAGAPVICHTLRGGAEAGTRRRGARAGSHARPKAATVAGWRARFGCGSDACRCTEECTETGELSAKTRCEAGPKTSGKGYGRASRGGTRMTLCTRNPTSAAPLCYRQRLALDGIDRL